MAKGKAKDEYVLVRMPAALKKKLRSEAYNEQTDMTTIVNQVLADRYGITYERRTSRTAPFGGGQRAA